MKSKYESSSRKKWKTLLLISFDLQISCLEIKYLPDSDDTQHVEVFY